MRRPPHQTSDLFKRGPAQPHSLKEKHALAFQKPPEMSLPGKPGLKVAAARPGGRALSSLSLAERPGRHRQRCRSQPASPEGDGRLAAGRALQIGSENPPLSPSQAASPHCPPFSGPPWLLASRTSPPGPPPLARGISEKGRAPAPPPIRSEIRRCRQVRRRALAWPRGPAAGGEL